MLLYARPVNLQIDASAARCTSSLVRAKMASEVPVGVPEVRVFAGDSVGQVKALYTQSRREEIVVLRGRRYGPAMACQGLVRGTVSDVVGSNVDLIAIARKNGEVDIVQVPTSELSADREHQDKGAATLLHTIREDRMRVGIERWVKICLSSTGVWTCTSGGYMRYIRLSDFQLGPRTEGAGNAVALEGAPQEAIARSTVEWSVPGPINDAAFYPEAGEPAHVACGGEHVPLSVWSLRQVLERAAGGKAGDDNEEERAGDKGDQVDTNARDKGDDGKDADAPKQGKKRAASGSNGKQKELNPGEIWRAKNLPNDSLSLQRHPLIRRIGFLRARGAAAEAVETRYDGWDPRTAILVGAKDGSVRVYEPAKKQRHMHEWQVIPKNQGSLRTMLVYAAERCAERLDALTERLLFLGDTARHLVRAPTCAAHVLDLTGTVSDMGMLPGVGPLGPLLLSSSLDKLVRLLELGKRNGNQWKRGTTLCTYFTGLESTMAIAIDPSAAVSRAPEAAPADDDERVWSGMAVVGGARAGDAKADGDGGDDEDDETDSSDTRDGKGKKPRQ
ncbi:hypothetical protein MSPP1_001766, partial [Malassezia sp. CBS 17886]